MTYLRWVYKIAIQLTSLLLRVLADVNASFLGEAISYMLRYKHKSSNEEKQNKTKKLKHVLHTKTLEFHFLVMVICTLQAYATHPFRPRLRNTF